LSLSTKLDALLISQDPMVHELFKGLKLWASLKFHKKQFRSILETATENKLIDFVAIAREGRKEEEILNESIRSSTLFDAQSDANKYNSVMTIGR
jgi:hypothetical protein